MVEALKRSAEKLSYSWFERFGQPSVSAPAWPLDADQLRRTVIYWPSEYQWAPSASFLDPIRLGLAHWGKLEQRPIAQPYQGVCVFELCFDGATHRIAIDYSDYVGRVETDCLATVSLYFKMQHLKEGYALAEKQRRKILPGGYVMGDRRATRELGQIRAAARTMPYRSQVYGRFGLNFAREIRSSVVQRLESDPVLRYEGGMKKVPYRQSLIEASRSKICIDLPGNGDFCFRLLDYLAVGAFVIAYPHRTVLPLPLVEGHHLVYMKPDLSDVVDLCRYYLRREDERQAMQSNAAEYFDHCCHYQQLGTWYLSQCLAMASQAQAPSLADPIPGERRHPSAA